jgi:hypothetical protein
VGLDAQNISSSQAPLRETQVLFFSLKQQKNSKHSFQADVMSIAPPCLRREHIHHFPPFPMSWSDTFFEFSAHYGPPSTPTLVLVAWPVKIWYVILTLDGDAKIAIAVLTASRGVKDLWLGAGYTVYEPFPLLRDLPLTHPSGRPRALFGGSAQINFTHRSSPG